MNTINKDKRRKYEMSLQNKYHEGWLLSLKYSNILMDNIDSKNLYTICSSIHGEFTHQLKINGLNDNNNNNNNKKKKKLYTSMGYYVKYSL